MNPNVDLTSPSKLGLVGLGAMGQGVALNLIKKGHALIGFDVNPKALEWLAAQGGTPGVNLKEQVRELDVLICFVVNHLQTEEVLFGAQGAVAGLKPGALVITCSTMPPEYVRELGRRLQERGLGLVDAPVTGGRVGAHAGSLTIMASGHEQHVQRARPILECFGKRVYVLGDQPGMGSQMKVINQLLCGVHIAAAGEALALAKRCNLPLATSLEILSNGAASSWMLGDRGPRMVSEGFDDVASAVNIFVKDLGLVIDAARQSQFDAPIAHAAHQSFLAAAAEGLGALDDSAVFKHYCDQPPKA
jgi:3-hydroxyisobutyrate dehydrogenase